MLMKFFRKYNKQLLAFFMALLMIVFIGGEALQGLITPSRNPMVATSNLGPIMFRDQQDAQAETQLLDSFGQSWQRPLSSDARPLELVDWILLSREADSYGVSVQRAGIQTTPGFELAYARLRAVAQQLRVKPEHIVAALARLESIRQAALAFGGAAAPSEAELLVAARDALETVRIHAVLVPAEAFVNSDRELAAEELEAHFATYRERERGQGLEFGYYRKPAVQVQYIKIDHAAVAANLAVPNLEKKAMRFYEDNKTSYPAFLRRPEELNAPDPAEQGLIVGPPAPKPSPFKDWEEVKDAAIAEVRRREADEHVQRIVDYIIPFTSEAWLDATKKDSGYKSAPDVVKSPEYYDHLVERMPAALRVPGAVSVATTDFFTQDEAANVPDIGPTILKGDTSLVGRNFRSVAFLNEAIVPTIPEGAGSEASDYLAMFQTASRTLSNYRTGDAYVYRVVDARAGGAPESMEADREQVIADLRLKNAFEAARARAESLRTCPGTLSEGFEADAELTAFRETEEGSKTGHFDPPPFSRVLRGQAAMGRSGDGVFVGGGLGKIPNEVVDGCFALAEAHDKRTVFELPERSAALVVEWVETIAGAEDDFNALRGQLLTQLSDNRRRAFLTDWLDPEQIRARNGFQLEGRR